MDRLVAVEFLAAYWQAGTHRTTQNRPEYSEMIAHQCARLMGESVSRESGGFVLAEVLVRNPNGTNVTKCWRVMACWLYRDGHEIKSGAQS